MLSPKLTPDRLKPKPQTLNLKSQALNPFRYKARYPNPEPSTLNPKPQTHPNPKSHTLNLKP